MYLLVLGDYWKSAAFVIGYSDKLVFPRKLDLILNNSAIVQVCLVIVVYYDNMTRIHLFDKFIGRI